MSYEEKLHKRMRRIARLETACFYAVAALVIVVVVSVSWQLDLWFLAIKLRTLGK